MSTWKDIPGYDGLYQANIIGQIRRARGGQGAKAGLILIPSRDRGGYSCVHLSKNGLGRTHRVHVLVCAAFWPGQHCGHEREVNHKDRDKSNNALANLELMSHLDNIRHAIGNGRRCGEGNPRARLTESQVLFIRQNYKPRDHAFCPSALAKRFNVSARTVRSVLIGRTWKHEMGGAEAVI